MVIKKISLETVFYVERPEMDGQWATLRLQADLEEDDDLVPSSEYLAEKLVEAVGAVKDALMADEPLNITVVQPAEHRPIQGDPE